MGCRVPLFKGIGAGQLLSSRLSGQVGLIIPGGQQLPCGCGCGLRQTDPRGGGGGQRLGKINAMVEGEGVGVGAGLPALTFGLIWEQEEQNLKHSIITRIKQKSRQKNPNEYGRPFPPPSRMLYSPDEGKKTRTGGQRAASGEGASNLWNPKFSKILPLYPK